MIGGSNVDQEIFCVGFDESRVQNFATDIVYLFAGYSWNESSSRVTIFLLSLTDKHNLHPKCGGTRDHLKPDSEQPCS